MMSGDSELLDVWDGGLVGMARWGWGVIQTLQY